MRCHQGVAGGDICTDISEGFPLRGLGFPAKTGLCRPSKDGAIGQDHRTGATEQGHRIAVTGRGPQGRDLTERSGTGCCVPVSLSGLSARPPQALLWLRPSLRGSGKPLAVQDFWGHLGILAVMSAVSFPSLTLC